MRDVGTRPPSEMSDEEIHEEVTHIERRSKEKAMIKQQLERKIAKLQERLERMGQRSDALTDELVSRMRGEDE